MFDPKFFTTVVAYLDPGTGSILIQVLIGALAGIGIFVATSWSRIKNLFRKKQPQDAEKPADEQ